MALFSSALSRLTRKSGDVPMDNEDKDNKVINFIHDSLETLKKYSAKLAAFLKKAASSTRKFAKKTGSKLNALRKSLGEKLRSKFGRSKDESEEGSSDNETPDSTGPPGIIRSGLLGLGGLFGRKKDQPEEEEVKKKGFLSRLFSKKEETATEKRERKAREEVEEEKKKNKDKLKKEKAKKKGFLGKLLGGIASIFGKGLGILGGIMTGGLKTVFGKVLPFLVPGLSGMTSGIVGGAARLLGGLGLKGLGLGLGLAGKGALATAGFLATNPIGWAILATGAVYAGFKLYQHYTRNDLPKGMVGNLIASRIMMYGVHPAKDKTFNAKLRNWDITWEKEIIEYSKDVAIVPKASMKKARELAAKMADNLGVDLEDKMQNQRFVRWLNERYLPVLQAYCTAMNKVRPGKTIFEEEEDIPAGDYEEFLTVYTPPSEVFNVKETPFGPEYVSMTTMTDVVEQLDQAKAGILKKSKDDLAWHKKLNPFNKRAKEIDEAIKEKERLASDREARERGERVRSVGTSMDKFRASSERLSENYKGIEKIMGDGSRLMDPVASMKAAASKTGVPYSVLATLAKLESSMDPYAASSTSSAKGMFQFIDDTWERYRKKIVSKYGVPEDASPFNAYYSALAAAEYFKDIKKALPEEQFSQAGISEELTGYLGHFMGINGAKNFLTKYIKNPNDVMNNMVSEKVVNANKGLMNGVSGRGFIASMQKKIDVAMNTPDENYLDNAKKNSIRRLAEIDKRLAEIDYNDPNAKKLEDTLFKNRSNELKIQKAIENTTFITGEERTMVERSSGKDAINQAMNENLNTLGSNLNLNSLESALGFSVKEDYNNPELDKEIASLHRLIAKDEEELAKVIQAKKDNPVIDVNKSIMELRKRIKERKDEYNKLLKQQREQKLGTIPNEVSSSPNNYVSKSSKGEAPVRQDINVTADVDTSTMESTLKEQKETMDKIPSLLEKLIMVMSTNPTNVDPPNGGSPTQPTQQQPAYSNAGVPLIRQPL